ncbi:acyl-CoA thioesterase II [Allomyces macrogynus ATCC 38327]|uniref:Acyl-CoA thioesterase II n=1 Tax=Allomyces macrogynus (strain ATCC 38327) TaxID=578462 RepID=A0A0L0TE37_ALLM3|nr:acyl-CoA thioesterase II [Allomyces macrogynus ATCC 38327]|eukprot:KNE72941.1 acyl-CoA thioesterase II [Allomyces macrogynus ATCC 38327]
MAAPKSPPPNARNDHAGNDKNPRPAPGSAAAANAGADATSSTIRAPAAVPPPASAIHDAHGHAIPLVRKAPTISASSNASTPTTTMPPPLPSQTLTAYGPDPPAPRIEDSLRLEELDKNLFRCHPEHLWLPVGSRGVFGGQIIGLALVAATHTVPRAFSVHSLHSYFLLGGDNTKPILFHVTPMRDARSFMTRQVTANQDGKPIFVMLCSFMRGEDRALVHQYEMPTPFVDPEALPTREQVFTGWLDRVPAKYHDGIHKRLAEPIPVDMRFVAPTRPTDYTFPKRKDPRALVWMKSKTKLPADQALHNCVAAYCSDHHLVWTTLYPHAVTGWTNPKLNMIMSLDHSIWFHADFRADDWLLYEMESPRASGNRGLALGRLWAKDGTLVMSCAQEGLIRATFAPDKPLSVPPLEGVDDRGVAVLNAPPTDSPLDEINRNTRKLPPTYVAVPQGMVKGLQEMEKRKGVATEGVPKATKL